MKYLITESQLDKFIFKYIDLKRFIQIERGGRIYFVNSEDDEYAQIRFDKDSEVCFINIDLVKEISSFFSLERSDSKEVISMWVENTLQMKVNYTSCPFASTVLTVENTLQMKVNYTTNSMSSVPNGLRIPN